ncbi:MAG: hypothetical protein J6A33_04310 [Alphaproteobacteria bacterium]|nr:hypothetical protein [Alphaproteobacteria bacterium]
MFLEIFRDSIAVNWKSLKGKTFITEDDLAEAIASWLLIEKKYVFVQFEGLYETKANHDEINLLVDKVYHTLWQISGEYYLLCVSEKGPSLVHADIYQGAVDRDKMCLQPGIYNLVEMDKLPYKGRLYLKNEII